MVIRLFLSLKSLDWAQLEIAGLPITIVAPLTNLKESEYGVGRCERTGVFLFLDHLNEKRLG
jgi:hypothetical protein